MRRAVVLAVLLAVMIGVTALSTTSDNPHDPLTLAAIGFVVLAAFTIAEVASSLGLPRVTGYIVGGVVLGPSAADILSSRVVDEMRMFNTLALGLIAISAGLELDVGQIRKMARTLAATIGVKVLLGGALVSTTLLVVQAIAAPLPLTSQGEVVTMAIVMAALSLGTSPAIALAVMNETRARGRIMDLVLGSAVLKDLVVVVVLALATAIGNTLLTPDLPLASDVLWGVALEVGSSVVAGSVLGLLLILYIRYVHAEMLFFVAATILVVSEVGAVLHLELLLVFITAGFVVRNFSKHEHELMKPIEMVALPVFVVFFTIAGASVDLRLTLSVLPLALALCFARAVTYAVASRVGGRVGGEDAAVRETAWLGYLPQAGVTLGLVGVAASRLPELSTHIATTGMAVVAVNLLVGPVTLRRALRAHGEIPEEGKDRGDADAPASVRAPAGGAVISPVELAARIAHTPLASLVMRSSDATAALVHEFVARELRTFTTVLADSVAAPLARAGGNPIDVSLHEWSTQPRAGDPARRSEVVRRLFDDLAATLAPWPELVEAPYEPPAPSQRARSAGARMRARAAHVLWRISSSARGRTRRVPARLAARVFLEPAMATLAQDVLRAWSQAEATATATMERAAKGEIPLEEAEGTVRSALARWTGEVEERARATLLQAHVRLADTLRAIDGPELPLSGLRYSRSAADVKAALGRLADDAKAWTSKLAAARGNLTLTCALARVARRGQTAVHQRLLEPLAKVAGELGPAIHAEQGNLIALGDRLAGELQATDVAPVLDACRRLFPRPAQQELEGVGARFRASTALHALAVELRELVAELPEELTVLRKPRQVADFPRPAELTTRTVPLRELAAERMLRDFLPAVDDEVRETSALLIEAAARVRAALDVAVYALETRARIDGPAPREDEPAREGLARAAARLAAIEAEVEGSVATARSSIGERLSRSLAALLEDAAGGGTAAVVRAAESSLGKLLRRAEARLVPARAKLTSRLRAARTFLLRVSGRDLSPDLGVRDGEPAPDALEIRAHIERSAATSTLPPAYARLFDPRPIRDHRLFAANRDRLDAALAAERAWLGGGPSSALVVGKHGSGRTSLLNLCELEMSAPRVVRPRHLRRSGPRSFLDALAYELDCRPDGDAIEAALREGHTAIILDDLEHWVKLSPAGIASFEELLGLVVRTRESAFWLAAVEESALRVLEDVLPVRQAFARVVTIPPLGAEALLHVIEARHRLSGRDIVHPRNTATRLIGRLRRESEHRVFFRVMATATEGNVARAMDAWLRAVELRQTGEVVPHVEGLFTPGMRFVGQLPPRQTALLVAILRFGPMARGSLSELLGLPIGEVERHVSFLLAATLLEQLGASELLGVPARVRRATVEGLRDAGVWR